MILCFQTTDLFEIFLLFKFGVDDVLEFVTGDTEKCPLSVLACVRNKRVNNFIDEI